MNSRGRKGSASLGNFATTRVFTRSVFSLYQRLEKPIFISCREGVCGKAKKRKKKMAQEFHVLAVDDSLVDRKVIERLLKISCCKVTSVESGSRALQYLGLDGDRNSVGFDELKVNLIMTDYSMPGMTGYDLLKKIKGSTKFREIPVVVMSSENVLALINSCLEEGAEDFLVKPVKLSDVERLLHFLLRGGETHEQIVSSNPGKRKTRDESSCCLIPLPITSPSSTLGCDHRPASPLPKRQKIALH